MFQNENFTLFECSLLVSRLSSQILTRRQLKVVMLSPVFFRKGFPQTLVSGGRLFSIEQAFDLSTIRIYESTTFPEQTLQDASFNVSLPLFIPEHVLSDDRLSHFLTTLISMICFRDQHTNEGHQCRFRFWFFIDVSFLLTWSTWLDPSIGSHWFSSYRTKLFRHVRCISAFTRAGENSWRFGFGAIFWPTFGRCCDGGQAFLSFQAGLKNRST